MSLSGGNKWMDVLGKARKAGYKNFDYRDKTGKLKHYIFAKPTNKIKLRVITEVDKNGKVINKSVEKAAAKKKKKALKEKKAAKAEELKEKAKAKAKSLKAKSLKGGMSNSHVLPDGCYCEFCEKRGLTPWQMKNNNNTQKKEMTFGECKQHRATCFSSRTNEETKNDSKKGKKGTPLGGLDDL